MMSEIAGVGAAHELTETLRAIITEARHETKAATQELMKATPPASQALITEDDIVATKDKLSDVKRALIDLQTKKSLAASLASDTPFAALEHNKVAISTSHAAKRSANHATKAQYGAKQEEVGRLAEQVASLHTANAAAVASIEELTGSLQKALDGGGVSGMGTLTVAVPTASTGPASSEGGAAAGSGSSTGAAGSMGTRSVTITSESEARAVISELTVMAATLRSAAMGDAMAESATREQCRSVAADAAAQERQLEALKRERALRAQAVVTQSQRAGEAEKHYGTMAATMAAIFGPTVVVGAVDASSAGASAGAGRGLSDGIHAGSGR